MPPSQRERNRGCAAVIAGRSSATAASCARTAVAAPIAAGLPPSRAIAATSTAPNPASKTYGLTPCLSRSRLPAPCCPSAPDTRSRQTRATPAETPAGDGEERQGMQPAVDQPAERAEGENGEREGEAQGDVGPALAVALARLVVAIWHQPSGNLSACEIFRRVRGVY